MHNDTFVPSHAWTLINSYCQCYGVNDILKNVINLWIVKLLFTFLSTIVGFSIFLLFYCMSHPSHMSSRSPNAPMINNHQESMLLFISFHGLQDSYFYKAIYLQGFKRASWQMGMSYQRKLVNNPTLEVFARKGSCMCTKASKNVVSIDAFSTKERGEINPYFNEIMAGKPQHKEASQNQVLHLKQWTFYTHYFNRFQGKPAIVGSMLDSRRPIVPTYLKGAPFSWFHLGQRTKIVVS